MVLVYVRNTDVNAGTALMMNAVVAVDYVHIRYLGASVATQNVVAGLHCATSTRNYVGCVLMRNAVVVAPCVQNTTSRSEIVLMKNAVVVLVYVRVENIWRKMDIVGHVILIMWTLDERVRKSRACI